MIKHCYGDSLLSCNEVTRTSRMWREIYFQIFTRYHFRYIVFRWCQSDWRTKASALESTSVRFFRYIVIFLYIVFQVVFEPWVMNLKALGKIASFFRSFLSRDAAIVASQLAWGFSVDGFICFNERALNRLLQRLHHTSFVASLLRSLLLAQYFAHYLTPGFTHPTRSIRAI